MVTKVGINGFGRIGRLVNPHLLFTSEASMQVTDVGFRSSVMRKLCTSLVRYGICSERCANCLGSVEHGQVNVVAVNDPFIDPKYAVSNDDRLLTLSSTSLIQTSDRPTC